MIFDMNGEITFGNEPIEYITLNEKLKRYVTLKKKRIRYFLRKRKEDMRIFLQKRGESSLYGAFMVFLFILIIWP